MVEPSIRSLPLTMMRPTTPDCCCCTADWAMAGPARTVPHVSTAKLEARARQRARKKECDIVLFTIGGRRGSAEQPAEEFKQALLMQIVPRCEQHQSDNQNKTDLIAHLLHLRPQRLPCNGFVRVEQQVPAVQNRDRQKIRGAGPGRRQRRRRGRRRRGGGGGEADRAI